MRDPLPLLQSISKITYYSPQTVEFSFEYLRKLRDRWSKLLQVMTKNYQSAWHNLTWYPETQDKLASLVCLLPDRMTECVTLDGFATENLYLRRARTLIKKFTYFFGEFVTGRVTPDDILNKVNELADYLVSIQKDYQHDVDSYKSLNSFMERRLEEFYIPLRKDLPLAQRYKYNSLLNESLFKKLDEKDEKRDNKKPIITKKTNKISFPTVPELPTKLYHCSFYALPHKKEKAVIADSLLTDEPFSEYDR